MKLIALALISPLLISCGSTGYDKTTNASALYSPPCVTLEKGTRYYFKEGVMIGDGQSFVSQFYYQRALVTGK